ncbi:MAG: hypothetical protein R3F35_02415 [Myxococcota bacterium]
MIIIEVTNPAEFLKLTPTEQAVLSAREPLTETEKRKRLEREETDTENFGPARPLVHRLEAAKLVAMQEAKSSGIDKAHVEQAARARLKCGLDASPDELLSEARKLAEAS